MPDVRPIESLRHSRRGLAAHLLATAGNRYPAYTLPMSKQNRHLAMPENRGSRRPALSQLLRIMAAPTKANQTVSREAQAAANRPARVSFAA